MTMVSDPKFIAARARLNALFTHLPSFVYEQNVADYHEILNALEESSGADLSSFRIPSQKMNHPVVGAVRGSYRGGRGRLIHDSKKQCDHDYFAAQIMAVREFLAEIQNSAVSPSPHPRENHKATGSTRSDTCCGFERRRKRKYSGERSWFHNTNLIGQCNRND
jgi:hypothetical protein